MNQPHSIRVSIVTPSYNQAQFIEQTIQSISGQSYPHIEYWIVDGGSDDGTLEIIQRYGDQLQWVSEPDRGQTHAINKGFERVTGDILAYVNSDDLLTPEAVQVVVEFFAANPEARLVYGDAMAIDEQGKSQGLRAHVAPCDFDFLLNWGDAIVQPAAFWRRDLWLEQGGFDESYRYIFDYEYWLRTAQKYPLHYIPRTLAKERIHTSAKTSTGGLARILELERLGKQYGRDGMPKYFRPEAAATYLQEAVIRLRQRDFEGAKSDLLRAYSLNNSVFKLTLFLLAMLIFGSERIPQLRLYSNFFRRLRKGQLWRKGA